MIHWAAFKHKGAEYDLTHLHPAVIEYIQPAQANKPVITYIVDVWYSLHCFSKASDPTADPLLNYSDTRETRSFDFRRYELSKQLPLIIRELNIKKCMHTGKGNFFVIEVTMPSGLKDDYEVYFDVKRSNTNGGALLLFVQSAYVRDPMHGNRLAVTKKISLYTILNNRLTGKPIKLPQ